METLIFGAHKCKHKNSNNKTGDTGHRHELFPSRRAFGIPMSSFSVYVSYTYACASCCAYFAREKQF